MHFCCLLSFFKIKILKNSCGTAGSQSYEFGEILALGKCNMCVEMMKVLGFKDMKKYSNRKMTRVERKSAAKC